MIMIDIPQVSLEEPAGPQDEVLVHHLSSGEIAPLDVVRNFTVIHRRDVHPFHHTVKEQTVVEVLLDQRHEILLVQRRLAVEFDLHIAVRRLDNRKRRFRLLAAALGRHQSD